MTYAKARDEYLASEILTAGPVRRVQMLYEAALGAIAKARQALAVKDIRGRVAQVNYAIEILTELAFSLDHSAGAELTAKLAALYDYAQRRLLDGNSQQKDEPFAEVDGLLKTLLEAWKAIPEVSEKPSAAGAGDMLFDYGVSDTVCVGSVLAGVDQLG